MNPLLQSDGHPDAESLNAFVERVLPQPERAGIVAHLGACARCREVVFLAQAAAEADAAPPAAVEAKPHPAHSRWASWKRNWRIALIPAAALATAAGLLVWVQFKTAPPSPTVAQVSHPSPLPSFSAATAASVPPPAQSPAASAPPAAVQGFQSKAARAGQKISPSPDQKTLPVPPVAPPKAPAEVGAGQDLLSMARQAPLQESEIKPPLPAASNAQWVPRQSALAQRDSAMNAKVMSTQAIAAPPPPAPVPPNMAAVHGSPMISANAGPLPLTAEPATPSQMERMPQPLNGLAALRLSNHPRLPSGLNAVSSAVMLDRILAVDPDGALFLSRDAAKHWERVPVQWTGKAVLVQAPPRESYPLTTAAQNDAAPHTSPVASISITAATPTPAPTAPADQPPATSLDGNAPVAPGLPPPAVAKAALIPPGMLFRLINDHRQVWISADGKVWHPQEGRE
jgi:hypothetical protein